MLQFYTEQFELKFKELINDLFNKYPDKLEIIVYKRTLDKLDYGKVSENFCTSLNEYSDLITNKDESLFSVEKLEFIDQLKFGDIWTEELTQPEKDTIWQYIQILYLLSNLIHKTPNENNTSIASTAPGAPNSENKADKSNIADNFNFDEIFKSIQENAGENKEKFNLNNLSKDEINKATNDIKEKLNNSDNNIMTDMIGEINSELNSMVLNKDKSEVNENKNNEIDPQLENAPQVEMMSKMLNINDDGIKGILNIATKVSQKYQQKVESGELNPEDLMKSAQSMLMGMQNIK